MSNKENILKLKNAEARAAALVQALQECACLDGAAQVLFPQVLAHIGEARKTAQALGQAANTLENVDAGEK